MTKAQALTIARKALEQSEYLYFTKYGKRDKQQLEALEIIKAMELLENL